MSPPHNSALPVSGIAVPRWSVVERVRHASGLSKASFCSLFSVFVAMVEKLVPPEEMAPLEPATRWSGKMPPSSA